MKSRQIFRSQDHLSVAISSSREEAYNLNVGSVFIYGDALRQKNGCTRVDLDGYIAETRATGENLDQRTLLKRLEALENLRTHLNTNVHERLALEAGFLAAFA